MIRMNKSALPGLLLCFLCIWPVLSQAAIPGPYAGVGLGPSKLDTPSGDIFAVDPNSGGHTAKSAGGLGGRAYAGFNFNHYFGIEAGIARYAKTRYTGSLNNLNSSLEYSMNTIDIVAKTYLPLGESKLSLYALGGAAAVNNAVKYQDGGVPVVSDFLALNRGSKSQRKIRPVYGVGIGYDIPKSHMTAGVEFKRVQGLGNINTSTNAMPPANMATFSLTYNFD
ncbi:hypothetical protein AQUSIP_05180 [Aquicella siphonis]|uniref:Outer membrane protein beta-barrel domain-containing protein n=1 Tax=Aquicella siphonis TaxID=254247 RepID=A0A5E4PE53_9COXI|nr:outer membrane beta-barrel protein [Aquicella siphonis]VVC75230.1 hypothetical protein AQUSIP_05180 [Aquicella siphonis]